MVRVELKLSTRMKRSIITKNLHYLNRESRGLAECIRGKCTGLLYKSGSKDDRGEGINTHGNEEKCLEWVFTNVGE